MQPDTLRSPAGRFHVLAGAAAVSARRWVVLLTSWLLLGAVAAHAAEPVPSDGPRYRVDRFALEYAGTDPALPSIGDLEALSFRVTETPSGYVAPRPGEVTELTIGGIAPGSSFYASAIRAAGIAIVKHINEAGISGVSVRPRDLESPSGRDLRPDGATALTVVVSVGQIAETNMIAQGPRFDDTPPEQRVNNPVHARIRRLAPTVTEPGDDLIRTGEIEDYASWLSRHPGRFASAELAPGEKVGTTQLDYKVRELKPWYAYVQLSNTGTDQTTPYRQRFGFIHNQVTNRDDILRLDYITGNFDEVNAVIGSYDSPINDAIPRLRLRIDGAWSEFDSSQQGFSFLRFQGDQWYAGADLTYNVFQYKDFFVDLRAGARWQEVKVNQQLFGLKDESNFFFGRLGLRMERIKPTSAFFADLQYNRNFASIAGTLDETRLTILGRVQPDRRFQYMTWNVRYSFFLEPLIYREAWSDPQTPGTSTLAHEISIRFEGQVAFDNRLIPEFQKAAGGFYTVRGYPQTVVAGDDVWIGRVEYRLHIPRLFQPADPVNMPLVGRFNVVSPQAFIFPDWDLIFRVFGDIGFVELNKPTALENFAGLKRETLRSVGAGLELQLKRNLNVRFDWGIALDEVRGGLVSKYSSEYHVVLTFLY